jgi:Trypsin-co-occurring domain 2
VLELAKVIRDLRAELEKAIVAADGETLLFELGPIELELSLAIEAGAHADAKVRFWVVDAGAGTSVDQTNSQRITLTLTPKLGPDGASPYVSGTADERRR